MPIKSFRGLIASDAIQTINLHTNNGSKGYRIVKFEIMPNAPGAANHENIVKIYAIPQTLASVDGVVDFSDNTLLGAAYAEGNASSLYSDTQTIIFDNMVFNQDIDITHKNVDGSAAINYYIELEEINLDLNANTMATLKDIRNIKSNE
jgi:hypothetical protein